MTRWNQIVWLASYPKSGNTWTRLFLDAYFLGEIDINELVCSIADDNARRHQIGDGSDIREFPVDIQNLTRPMGLLRLVRAWQDNHYADVPLFVKTHAAHVVANGIEQLPACLTKSVIHIVRDPRSVCPSFAKHMGISIDEAIEAMSNKYNVLGAESREMKVADVITSWDFNVKSYLNADTHDVLTVRYEDMKKEPHKAFKRILEHAGAPVDEERIAKAIETASLDNAKKQESEKGFKESSPFAKNQFFGEGGSWEGKLTKRQAHKIEKKFQRTMKRLRYI